MSTEYLENKVPLNGAQYTTMDFPTYYDELLKVVKAEYGDVYDDFASTSVGVMFVHVFSYGLSQLSWMVDRRASANYFETAESRAELARLCRRIGRKLRSGVPSSTDLTVTCDALTAPVTMPKGFKFQGPGDIVFENSADILLPAGTTSFTPFASEAESKEIKYTGTGEANQSFEIPGTDEEEGIWVSQGSVQVYVNGVLWTENDFFELEKSNQYEVHYLEDPVEVVFGDGVVGNIPPTGADITIRYTLTHGSRGNVNKNQITSAIDELVVAGDSVALVVTNAKNTSGGLDPEDIEFARKVIPQLFAAHESAVTEGDYDALINSFVDATYGAVAKGYAVSSRSTAADSVSIGLIDGIDGETNNLESDIQTYYLSNNDQITGITSSLTEMTNQMGVLDVSVTDISSALSDMQNINQDIGTTINKIKLTKAAADTDIVDLNALINASSALPAEKTSMTTVTNEISLRLATINIHADNAYALNESLVDGISEIDIANDNISDSKTALETEIANIAGFAGIISTNNESIRTIVIASSAAIDSYGVQLIAHLDEVLSADCKSNIVNVAALTTDADGFYADPSTGLLKALESYLQERKEVTQYVQVVSGVQHLLPADIEVTGKILPTYIKSQVESDISRVIDEILKNRDFATRLNIDDLYKAVENISGIDYINIEITAPVSRLDVKGNLVPQNLEIITKGTVTIVMEQ